MSKDSASAVSQKNAGASHPTIARVGKYLMLDLLGEGAFGKVRLAVDEHTGKDYAMKVMEKSHIKANELTLQVRREIAVMKAMRHPNIVNLHEVLTSSKNLYMVMDLVTGGELFDAVAEKGRLPESTARSYFQQLVDGVNYCHSRRVYHRDLKPENLLLSGDKQTLKITDFGLSSIKAQNASSELLHTIMGSPHYIAPEILTSASEGYEGAKVDVWAAGVILYGMLAGCLPFDEPNTRALYKAIVHNPIQYPPHFSYDVIKLLRAMLQKDPNRRPAMEQVRSFAWFKVDYEPAVVPPPKDAVSGSLSGKKSRQRPRKQGLHNSMKSVKSGQSGSGLYQASNISSAKNKHQSVQTQDDIATPQVGLESSLLTAEQSEKISSTTPPSPARKEGISTDHEIRVSGAESSCSPQEPRRDKKTEALEGNEVNEDADMSVEPRNNARTSYENLLDTALSPAGSRFSSANSEGTSMQSDEKRQESLRFANDLLGMKQSTLSDFISPVSLPANSPQAEPSGHGVQKLAASSNYSLLAKPLFAAEGSEGDATEQTGCVQGNITKVESEERESNPAHQALLGGNVPTDGQQESIFRPMKSLFLQLVENKEEDEPKPLMAPSVYCPDFDLDADGNPQWCIDSMEVFADFDVDSSGSQRFEGLSNGSHSVCAMTSERLLQLMKESKRAASTNSRKQTSIFGPLKGNLVDQLEGSRTTGSRYANNATELRLSQPDP